MLLYFSVTNVSTANPLKGVSKYFFYENLSFLQASSKNKSNNVSLFSYTTLIH